jgi:WD40 repeat protein
VAFSPDSSYVAAAAGTEGEFGGGGQAGEVRFWNVLSGARCARLTDFNGPVRALVFSSDSRRLLTASSNIWQHAGELRRYDLGPLGWGGEPVRQEWRSLPNKHLTGVCYAAAGDLIYVTGRDQNEGRVFQHRADNLQPTNVEVRDREGTGFMPNRPRLAPQIAAAGGDGRVAVMDRDGMTLRVFDSRLQAPGTLTAATGRFTALAAHAETGVLALACSDGVIRTYDGRTLKKVQELRGHRDEVLGLAYAPDGRRLASFGKDGVVKVWDPATGQELLTLPMQAEARKPPLAVAFSADNRWLAVAGGEIVYLFGSDRD